MFEIIILSKNGCDKAIMRSEYDAWRHRHCTVADTASDNFEGSGEKISNSPIFSPRDDLRTSLLLAGKRIIGEFI